MSEAKSKQELLNRANEILESGGSYTRVHNYLHNNCEDEVLIKQVAKEAITLDDNRRRNKMQKKGVNLTFGYDLIFGLLFLLGGISLTVYFWTHGVFHWVTLVIIGVGFLGLSMAVKRSKVYEREH